MAALVGHQCAGPGVGAAKVTVSGPVNVKDRQEEQHRCAQAMNEAWNRRWREEEDKKGNRFDVGDVVLIDNADIDHQSIGLVSEVTPDTVFVIPVRDSNGFVFSLDKLKFLYEEGLAVAPAEVGNGGSLANVARALSGIASRCAQPLPEFDFADSAKYAPDECERGWEHVKLQAIRALGSGQYGTVYLCKHKETGRCYAVKMKRNHLRLHHQALESMPRWTGADNYVPDHRPAIEQEAQRAVDDHPLIPTLHAVYNGRDGRMRYLIMDPIPKATTLDKYLSEVLDKQDNDDGHAQRIGILCDLASQLAHMYKKHVTHCDLYQDDGIQFGNLLVNVESGGGNARLHVIDFGYAIIAHASYDIYPAMIHIVYRVLKIHNSPGYEEVKRVLRTELIGIVEEKEGKLFTVDEFRVKLEGIIEAHNLRQRLKCQRAIFCE